MTKVLRGARYLDSYLEGCVAAIGNFDGVHLGHHALIQKAIDLAESLNTHSMVLTFEPHPRRVLNPKAFQPMICTPEQKILFLEQTGVDAVLIEHFNEQFAQVSAKDFIDQFLCESLKVKGVVVGQNFKFGHQAVGDANFLKNELSHRNILVDIMPPFFVEGKLCSSTEVRASIANGDVTFASKMLGRNYCIEGKVVKGEGRGKGIGVRTINLASKNELIPKNGVYATLVWTSKNKKPWMGATNIGTRPTFDEGEQTHIETHLLEFSGDLYGETVRLCFVERIRDEMKFSGPDMLVAQIKKDIDQIRNRLKDEPALS